METEIEIAEKKDVMVNMTIPIEKIFFLP